jgi:phenylpyruvate tautomerase PptA (4-oxalocrotonate tautomerase family)
MTVIAVTATSNRFTLQQRRELARTLTDAVLVPEVGQPMEAARVGFQVHFIDAPADHLAIGGVLASDSGADVIRIDVAVMDSHWPQAVRSQVIENLLAALTAATAADETQASWWVNFRTIDEGSWGSRGGVLSVHDLLESGAFTAEKVLEIRETTPRFTV